MCNVFERSANRNNGNNVANCNASGNVGNNNANNGNFAAPACYDGSFWIDGSHSGITPEQPNKEFTPSGKCREQCGNGGTFAMCGGNVNPIPTVEDAIGYDALLEAAEKCTHGVLWKGRTAYLYMHMLEDISRLCDELHAGSYRMGACVEFSITSPKYRVISSMQLRDRIVQRSLNDNVIYPLMSRSWIYDNYACQNGKGTDFGRNRMMCHLERFTRKHGLNGYVLTCDISGYYAHMLHDEVHRRFDEKLPSWAAEFARNALEKQYPGEVGFRPGSQMVQIAGIDYLDGLDHFIKERLRIKQYGRYMDDFILIHESQDYLNECKRKIDIELSRVGLSLHAEKTTIKPIQRPFGFLGFTYHATDTGVYMLVKSEKVKEQRRRLRRLARLVNTGRIDAADYLAALQCMASHDAKGASKILPEKIYSYGIDLIGGQK